MAHFIRSINSGESLANKQMILRVREEAARGNRSKSLRGTTRPTGRSNVQPLSLCFFPFSPEGRESSKPTDTQDPDLIIRWSPGAVGCRGYCCRLPFPCRAMGVVPRKEKRAVQVHSPWKTTASPAPRALNLTAWLSSSHELVADGLRLLHQTTVASHGRPANFCCCCCANLRRGFDDVCCCGGGHERVTTNHRPLRAFFGRPPPVSDATLTCHAVASASAP